MANLHLIETMLVSAANCRLLALHLARLERSAKALGFKLLPAQWRATIEQSIASCNASQSYRLRAKLGPDGTLELQLSRFSPLEQSQQVLIASNQLALTDPLRRHKTSRRQQLNQLRQQALTQGAFDTLLFNHQGQLLEGCVSNVFIQYQQQWFTPSLDLDILPGVMRSAVLAAPANYAMGAVIQQQPIDRNMLSQASRIVLTNAIVGCLPVQLLDAAS